MTNKEIAERLRALPTGLGYPPLTEAIEAMINELDPPRPKPGTVVRWCAEIDAKMYRFIEALQKIELIETDWYHDTDWNMERMRAIAREALTGITVGHEHQWGTIECATTWCDANHTGLD